LNTYLESEQKQKLINVIAPKSFNYLQSVDFAGFLFCNQPTHFFLQKQ
jgi:hypothetical protein